VSPPWAMPPGLSARRTSRGLALIRRHDLELVIAVRLSFFSFASPATLIRLPHRRPADRGSSTITARSGAASRGGLPSIGSGRSPRDTVRPAFRAPYQPGLVEHLGAS